MAVIRRRISNREITERKLTEKKIIEQNQKEEVLTKTTQNLQADIARDLHDVLGQNISMNLEYISEEQWSDPTHIQTQIKNMTKVATESHELIRAMLAILTIGNSTDPLRLFTYYAEQVAERSRLQIDITSQGELNQLSPLKYDSYSIFFGKRCAI